jgi:uncharacterized membrane protein YraQ (UPF0718 family)
VESLRFQGALLESLRLLKWYAQEHVLLCLVPAFFIAGAIGVFVSQNAVMKYFGPKASKLLSFGVASVSGTLLAVCSCTVLPLFGGIYMRGAGLGPAIAFLYSGPAINVLAIVMTARILGYQIGVARAIGAIAFSVVIGASCTDLPEGRTRQGGPERGYLYRTRRSPAPPPLADRPLFLQHGRGAGLRQLGPPRRNHRRVARHLRRQMVADRRLRRPDRLHAVAVPRRKTALLLRAIPVALLADAVPPPPVLAFTAGFVGLTLITFRSTPEMTEWRDQTWGFAKQITPLLLGGVLAAGFFLGTPEAKDAGIVPNRWIQALVGDDPVRLLRHHRRCGRRARLARCHLAGLDQLLRFAGRRADVFRHPDRSPHRARPDG